VAARGRRDYHPWAHVITADRDAAAALLGAALAEGRLTADEHGERLSATYAARTWHQLRQLTADLADTAGTTERRAASGMAAEPDLCLLCLLLIVCPPAGIAWWLLARRRPGADPDRQLTAAAAQAGGGPRAEDR
jgi:hypothetical protein